MNVDRKIHIEALGKRNRMCQDIEDLVRALSPKELSALLHAGECTNCFLAATNVNPRFPMLMVRFATYNSLVTIIEKDTADEG